MSKTMAPPPPRRQRRSASDRKVADRTGSAANGRPGSRPAVYAARPSIWRSPLVLVTVVAGAVMVAVIGLLVLTSQGGTPPASSLGLVRPPDSALTAYEDGEALGSVDAPVLLEVYSDYQCPVCGVFGRDYLPRLTSSLVAAGSLRIAERSIVILDQPGRSESLDAAAGASCAAREGAHWAFHDYLMWNQDGENAGGFRRDRLVAMAERVGLDRTTFEACIDDAAVRGEVVDRTARALADGIDRTPTFVVNGERIVGLASYDDLVALIEQKLAEATAG